LPHIQIPRNKSPQILRGRRLLYHSLTVQIYEQNTLKGYQIGTKVQEGFMETRVQVPEKPEIPSRQTGYCFHEIKVGGFCGWRFLAWV